jgi:hypothetical protein
MENKLDNYKELLKVFYESAQSTEAQEILEKLLIEFNYLFYYDK